MANTTLTLALDGDISLAAFVKTMQDFRSLVEALAREVTPTTQIDWLVEDLGAGSAEATIRGEARSPSDGEPVAGAFLVVGKSLQDGRPVPYGPRVAGPARAIVSVINDKVRSVRFETQEDDATVLAVDRTLTRQGPIGAFGAVEGRVQTLTSRDSLRFTLYDFLYDRAVSCYLQESQQAIMRDAWDRRAIVEGWVTRDALTGRPLSVRRIQRVTLLPDTPAGSYLNARGVLAGIADGSLPESTIRRARDA